MNRRLFIIAITFISFKSLTQDVECKCSTVYESLIEKLEENYIGLELKKAHGDYKDYEQRKTIYRDKAAQVERAECTKFLQEFLSYFEDGHLFVYELPRYSAAELEKYKNKIKSGTTNIDGVLKTLKFEENLIEKKGLDDIIGHWTDGISEFAIIEDEGLYKAYIINSTKDSIQKGELKATFKGTKSGFEGTYYSYSYAPRFVEGDIYKEGTLLVFTGANYWGKIDPDSDSRELKIINKENPRLPCIQKLDDNNTLFSVPSYMADSKKFIQVILDNLELLKNTTNLIIDIRGNVGGNALYFSFLDAIATNPMEGSQGLIFASEPTKDYFLRLSKNSPDIYNPVVERVVANMGKIVDGPDYPTRHFKPFESKIEQVAILTDEGCMSAAESFILHSKRASTKVTTFGSPTAGVIDYTSINTLSLNSGEQNIYFGYPTSTLHKNIVENGYNETGIIPDVPINSEVKDKIQFIVDYYNKG